MGKSSSASIIAGFGSESHLVWPECPLQSFFAFLAISTGRGETMGMVGQEPDAMIIDFSPPYTSDGSAGEHLEGLLLPNFSCISS